MTEGILNCKRCGLNVFRESLEPECCRYCKPGSVYLTDRNPNVILAPHTLENIEKYDRQKTEWQPIETAPRDGSEMLLYYYKSLRVGFYSNYVKFWKSAESNAIYRIQPTHWMPFPEPPILSERLESEVS